MATARSVFVDVDTQADFMLPGGKLYVPAAEQIIPNLQRLMAFAREHKVPVLSSVDAHAPDDPEFQQFPPHCVKGNSGQEKIPETLFAERTVIQNAASAFPTADPQCQQWVLEKQKFDLFTNINAAALIGSFHADEFVVFGVATEYCVRAAVLGLLRLGCPVLLVTDAIKGIDPAQSEATLRDLEAAGAKLVSTSDVLGHSTAAA
jgi:nicotinamidase/pyrazinamidase